MYSEDHMPIGFTLPFSISTGSLGYFEMTRDELSAVSENIKSLLLTNWGERVSRYYFGCNLREFLFEPLDADELREKIAERIMQQVGRWLPFISIKNLYVLLPADKPGLPENTVEIDIQFFLKRRPDLLGRVNVRSI
jgi:phage baseplate assembly protein W